MIECNSLMLMSVFSKDITENCKKKTMVKSANN